MDKDWLCKICKREMKPLGTCNKDDPAMDCGGDCLECVADSVGMTIEEYCSG